jgi:uncharacterized protein
MHMPFHHGIKLVEISEGARPLSVKSTAVIGLIATADDADPLKFPLNTPVEVTSELAIAGAGVTGTLASALTAIFARTRTIVLVIRVAASAVAATQTANAVGTVTPEGARTGIQALLSCQSMFGYKPKILGAPGLDSQGVTDALTAVAAKLNAFVYALAIGETNAAAIGYRADFGARELMLITPDVKRLNAAGETVASSAVATALGQRAWIDENVGWHKSLSNVALTGVLGVTRHIEFDLQSMANDAGILNQADITTIVRRDGYRFWGSRTCSDDPLFAFEPYVRTAQVLRELADELFWAIDKPLTPALAKAIVSSLDNTLKDLTRNGFLLGGEAWFDGARNPIDQIAQGKLEIDFDYTPVPPLESLGIAQRITQRHLLDFAARVNG